MSGDVIDIKTIRDRRALVHDRIHGTVYVRYEPGAVSGSLSDPERSVVLYTDDGTHIQGFQLTADDSEVLSRDMLNMAIAARKGRDKK